MADPVHPCALTRWHGDTDGCYRLVGVCVRVCVCVCVRERERESNTPGEHFSLFLLKYPNRLKRAGKSAY